MIYAEINKKKYEKVLKIFFLTIILYNLKNKNSVLLCLLNNKNLNRKMQKT